MPFGCIKRIRNKMFLTGGSQTHGFPDRAKLRVALTPGITYTKP